MPIANYSVLKGTPQRGEVAFNRSGGSPHYRIYFADGSQADVNIESSDGSEVLYEINRTFSPPNLDLLNELESGVTRLDRVPGGLALDYVREKINGNFMVERQDMSLLPIATPDPQNQLKNAVIELLNQASSEEGGTMYAFGSSYADTNGAKGVHNIHMNQGNAGKFSDENGTWSDGALFVNLPSSNTWIALFIAFQTESWNTDANGDPVSNGA